MALKKCRECRSPVSTRAASCPKCGAVLKRKTGCLGWIAILFVGFIALCVVAAKVNDGRPNNPRKSTTAGGGKSSKPPKAESALKEGDSVHVGYTTYAVWRSWWSNTLSDNPYLNTSPNASYLFVELTVRNDDKKARMVPPLKLIDENGAEYDASAHGWAVKGAIGILESLNPSVSKQGFVVFDVPRDRSYKLKLSGGFWSTQDAYVKLSPKASP